MPIGLTIGTVSYSAGALFFLLLTLLLLTSWRGRLQGGLLVLATLSTALWAGLLTVQVGYHSLPVQVVWSVEIWRDTAWFLFLFNILNIADSGKERPKLGVKRWALGVYGLCGVLLIMTWLPWEPWKTFIDLDLHIPSHILLAVIGLALIEQLYRNTRPEQRWSIKFLCLGIGSLFAYDFYVYSDALLFKRIDPDVWNARGAVCALVAPLIAVSAARNPQWSLDVFVSRGIVLHTATLLGAGVYLLTMAAAGYYIRYYGGSWGAVLQFIFLFGAGIVLLGLMFSGALRARMKVFLSKHFFSYKYDYREEWLRLMRTLSSGEDQTSLYERAIRGIAEIVECPGGALWMRRDTGWLVPTVRWGIPEFQGMSIPADSSLVRFLEERQWVIKMDEYDSEPELYGDLHLPDGLYQFPRAWLVIPLMHHDQLRGFVVLVQPRAPIPLNWEDIDLLKLVARQTAAYLTQYEAAQALADARQFEAFNRLSAFVIHDLKNLIAQLSLVVSNAARHKHNPDFMDDAIETIKHSVDKMNGLMKHLRRASFNGQAVAVDLGVVLRDVVNGRARQAPKPELETVEEGLVIRADHDRLSAVLSHIIQNAQEATRNDGYVRIGLRSEADRAIVEVKDNGIGMDATFIRERLFRPFDTTKGLTGMGIGAYESREFVRAQGGDVEVISKPDQGTTFRLVFPLAADDTQAQPRVEAN